MASLMEATGRGLAPRLSLLRWELPALASGLAHCARGFAKKRSEASGDSRLQKLLKVLEPQPIEPLELSPEDAAEAARRAKEYSRAKMAEHRAWQADLSTKLRLKQEAIAALPEGPIRAAAEEPDLTPFPLTRRMWTHTPPVEQAAKQASAERPGRKAIGTKRR